MPPRRPLRLSASALPAGLIAALLVASPGQARPVARTAAHELSGPVSGERTFALPRRASYVAVHWRGSPDVRVRVAFSRDGRRFGRARRVLLDEVGEHVRDGETYGALMRASGARAVRIRADRRIRRLSVLALTDRGGRVRPSATFSAFAQPKVVPRVDWGADESLRYSNGNEIWPPAFYPVQKLIVHHTASQNTDPNPAATIRSIYYYHAVTQGWGDIGYNFLIDEAGNVYEGRHTFDYPSGSSPTEEDANGNGVTAAHAQGYNSGTVGIALLGTLTNQDATPAARAALEKLLAWESDHHGIDPQGSSLYVNPVSGAQATFANIGGHRDVAATECPGGAFYATLPTIRSDVASLVAGGAPPPAAPTATTGPAGGVTTSSATLTGTVNPGGQQTTYRFEYGTTSAYGLTTPWAGAGAGTGPVSVSATISGLRSGRTYHYRLVATNASESSTGADRTFKTRRK